MRREEIAGHAADLAPVVIEQRRLACRACAHAADAVRQHPLAARFGELIPAAGYVVRRLIVRVHNAAFNAA
jgi:hypothetical protein